MDALQAVLIVYLTVCLGVNLVNGISSPLNDFLDPCAQFHNMPPLIVSPCLFEAIQKSHDIPVGSIKFGAAFAKRILDVCRTP